MPRFDRLELDPTPDKPGSKRSVPAGPGGPLPSPGPADEVRDEHYWLRLADQDRRKGLYEGALRYYSRALELDKSLVTGWVGQVQMLVFLGEYPEADLWARKALELFKNHPDLLAGRAQALCRKGDRAQARASCDASLTQPGQSAYRWLVRGELMVAAKETVDRHCFDKAVQIDPDWLVTLEAGLVYLHYDLPSKALPRVRHALEKNPDQAYPWLVLARCEHGLGLGEAAVRSVERCLELAPNHGDAQKLLHDLEQSRGSLGSWWRWLFRRG